MTMNQAIDAALKLCEDEKEICDRLKCRSVSPVIVSASRATDIPAFFGEWFLEQIGNGYCIWQNPFNRKYQLVSFKNLQAVVFWTKNPEPFLRLLDKFDRMNLAYYFQFTLNNYEAEKFEPNLASLKSRIKIFRELSRRIGKERVIWRFDPVLVSGGLESEVVFGRICDIGDQVVGFTDKLVFSFVDIANYVKVSRSIRKISQPPRELTLSEKYWFASRLADQKKSWHIEIATCAEDIDLSEYGITANRCIDPDLLRKIAPNNTDLLSYLSNVTKDKGQRNLCQCTTAKDIGQYNTCQHNCIYCYANS
ncbi:MAG: DUF1848 domain-containing protein [Planctomycetaceae bacterium]|nr:DUF1848 domain-containing protein [Planctomycetaceae bacterium]